MLTQFSRTIDSFWFSLPVRRQITILMTLPAICLAIALISLGRLRPVPIDDSVGTSRPPTSVEQPLNIAMIAIGATAGISFLSIMSAVYWVKRLHQDLYQRETQLIQTKLLTQAIETNLDAALMVMNRDWQIETVNPAGIKLFGYTATEVIGQDLKLLLSESAFASSPNLESTQSFAAHIITDGQHKLGSSFPVEVWVSDLPQLGKTLAIARDITYQQQLQTRLHDCTEQLTHTTASLEQSQSALRDMRLACHDLKSPLQAIAHLSIWIEADLDERVKGQTQDQIHLLRQRVQRMEELIHAIAPSIAQ